MHQFINLGNVSLNVYKLCFYLALASVPIVLFPLRKAFDFSSKKAVKYSVLTLVFGYISAMITAYLKHVLLYYASGGTYFDAEMLRNYGIPIFLPCFMAIYCLIAKDDFSKLTDYIAPSVYSVMTFIKIGCALWGCCYGEPDEHGIWNDMLGYRTFPVQVYDAVASLIIFVICIILIKSKRRPTGIIYPISGMLFAVSKGYWESFRVHESIYERNFWGTSWTLWQYWLLVLFIECLIWIVLVMKLRLRENKIN